MKDRTYSFLVPWLVDGALALVQTAMPLMALRLGASAILLGTIGWVAQAVRLPVCFASGHLSERIGRVKIIVPASCVLAVAAAGLGYAKSNLHIIIWYSVALVAVGAFYPALQARIGEVSKRGELTKNLGVYNVGWCVGGALAALGARWVIRVDLALAFQIAAAASMATAGLLLTWRSKPIRVQAAPEQSAATTHPNSLLLVARMGHFASYFAFGTVRILFPKLGVSLGWTEARVATVIALLLVGQAVGVLATTASPWWRGKLWPQVLAQAVILTCAVTTALATSPAVFGMAFFGLGVALAVAYTGALYHGLSARRDLGKNTGIHESLVAGGNISGCLFGGLAAQSISLRAPYILIACLALGCLVATAVLSRAHSDPTAPRKHS